MSHNTVSKSLIGEAASGYFLCLRSFLATTDYLYRIFGTPALERPPLQTVLP
jgi:hypothetical protein